jgi:hypothetical protein
MFFMVICIELDLFVDFQLVNEKYFFKIWVSGKII